MLRIHGPYEIYKLLYHTGVKEWSWAAFALLMVNLIGGLAGDIWLSKARDWRQALTIVWYGTKKRISVLGAIGFALWACLATLPEFHTGLTPPHEALAFCCLLVGVGGGLTTIQQLAEVPTLLRSADPGNTTPFAPWPLFNAAVYGVLTSGTLLAGADLAARHYQYDYSSADFGTWVHYEDTLMQLTAWAIVVAVSLAVAQVVISVKLHNKRRALAATATQPTNV